MMYKKYSEFNILLHNFFVYIFVKYSQMASKIVGVAGRVLAQVPKRASTTAVRSK